MSTVLEKSPDDQFLNDSSIRSSDVEIVLYATETVASPHFHKRIEAPSHS
jgi:hypothetical protein